MRLEQTPPFVYGLGSALARTLRYRQIGVDRLRAAIALSPTRSVIFCLYHQALFAVLGRHHHQHVAALTSLSRDGTMIAAYLERIGMRPVRGSSSRGGLKAARELITAIGEGWHAAITVDGPRGPYRLVKPGPFEIARRTGAPLVPLGVRASRDVVFKGAWDRFRLPMPAARVAMVYGEPLTVPPEYPTPAELLSRRRDLGHRLLALDRQASLLVGREPDPGPPATLRWLVDDRAASLPADG